MNCTVCQRNPERMNSDIAECSHADCPHRRRAWSERPQPPFKGPWPKNDNNDPLPLDVAIKKGKT